jgi:hypothetical protein
MSTIPADRATGRPRPVRGWPRRFLFMAGFVVALYLVTELLAFLIAALYHRDLGWIAASQEHRDQVRTELEGRPGQILQVHP